MATIEATWTEAGLALIAQRLAGDTGSLGVIDSFKVGEGGWELTSAGKVPRTPDPTLTDLDCILNPGRYPSNSGGFFQKALTGAELTYTAPGTVACDCTVAMGEFNDDGFGNPPEIYEIGLFIGATMVGYGTFAVEIKTPAAALPNVVTLVLELG